MEDEEAPCVATLLSSEQLVGLLELCLRSTYFSFRGQFYQLTYGLAMGSPVSSVVANIFMMNFEKRALRLPVHFEPRLWKRNVDDVFSITKKINTEWLLTHINDIDANIRFMIEREHESLLPFLDVSVKRKGGQIKTSVYR